MRRVNPEQIIAMLGIIGVIGLFMLAFYQLIFTPDEIKTDYCIARGYPRTQIVGDTIYCAGVPALLAKAFQELTDRGVGRKWHAFDVTNCEVDDDEISQDNGI